MSREAMEVKVIACLEELLPSNVAVRRDTDLLKAGINSMTFIRLVVSLEEAFEIEIEDSAVYLEHFSNVHRICDLLEQCQETTKDRRGKS